MTISKKLTIALTLALGIQFSAGAFTDTDIQNRNSIILVFAQELRNQNNKQAQTIATWLNAQVINKAYSREAIVEVITNHNLTEESKLTLFSAMIEIQKNDHKTEIVANICGGILLTGIFGTLAWTITNHPVIAYCPTRPHSQVNVLVGK